LSIFAFLLEYIYIYIYFFFFRKSKYIESKERKGRVGKSEGACAEGGEVEEGAREAAR
jgi:hypothetical protein